MSGAQSLPTGRKRSRPGGGSGSALDKTAKARLSTYDAKHAQKQKHALQSKKVNEYRKLVKRLKASDGAQARCCYQQTLWRVCLLKLASRVDAFTSS